MDTSMNETEAHQSFRSPPRRRRSTFFERRDSIVPHAMSENLNPFKKETEANDRHSEDLTRYRKALHLTSKYHLEGYKLNYTLCCRQYQMAVKASSRSRMSYSALSNEDIEFIKGKPNISKLIDSQQKLHKSVLEARALYRRASELDNVILTQSENIVSMVTDYILENSTIGPTE
ncbi:hypothetical protein HF086_012506 [Spodoptera exigua]|uniref:Uncharacterized protein n=1 Tax=Spodoptera exigua TaxID=7107 RepID=A0A922MZG6_SPOEX|nr:hypothetical protein HF086_012506 [Spodoptera exigua]